MHACKSMWQSRFMQICMPALSVPNRRIFFFGRASLPLAFWLGHCCCVCVCVCMWDGCGTALLCHCVDWGIGLVGGRARLGGGGRGGPCARMCRCVWKIFSTRPRASLKYSGRRIHRQFVSGDLHNCGRRAKLGMGRGDQPHGGLRPRRPAGLRQPWEETEGDEAVRRSLNRGAGGTAGQERHSDL